MKDPCPFQVNPVVPEALKRLQGTAESSVPPSPTTLPAHGLGSSDGPGSFGGCRELLEGQVLRPGAVTHRGHLLSKRAGKSSALQWVWGIPSPSFAPNLLVPIPAGNSVGSAAPEFAPCQALHIQVTLAVFFPLGWPGFSSLHLSLLEY